MSSAAQRLPWTQLRDESTLPGLGERVTHPEFEGIEFLHVRAKSLINHVPNARGLPFEYTINVYRGCSHACSYCLAGDTPVLMHDGRHKPIADIEIGDEIYGTVRDGSHRRYVTTRVLDHWSTVRQAYRVVLADGTELVASGDHRLLSERGWRHVAAIHEGGWERAHLKVGDRLVGPEDPRGPEGGSRRFAVVAIEPMGVRLRMYDITTGTGDFIADGVVSHNCFARPTHRYLELDPAEEFASVIVVKTNAVERLRAELRRPSWGGNHIALGTNTDPYQRCEGRYRLTRGVVETLTEARNPYSVLTKGTLVTRDLDVFTDAQKRRPTAVNLSIPTLDEEVWRLSEPGTPHPRRRMQAVAELNDAGVPSGVMLAPILPGISDRPEQLREAVTAAVDAGATFVHPITLHLRNGMWEIFTDWLAEHRPGLLERYRRLYRGGGNADRRYRERVGDLVEELVEEAGGCRRQPSPRRPGQAADAGGGRASPDRGGAQEQLALEL